MHAPQTVDSPDAAATLLGFLADIHPRLHERGRMLQLGHRVKNVLRRSAEHVSGNVDTPCRLLAVDLSREDGDWTSVCTCGVRGPIGCDHAAALAYEWLEQLRGAREAGPLPLPKAWEPKNPPASIPVSPPAPKLAFRQQWEPVLAGKLGRKLTSEEGAFLGRLSNIFHNFRTTHGWLNGNEVRQLGFDTLESRRAPFGRAYQGWWDTPPRNPLELWQYFAHDIESSDLRIPEFLRPVTDTAAIRERVKGLARREAVRRWTERFQQLAHRVERPVPAAALHSAPEPVELRLRLTASKWILETRERAEAPWKPAPRSLLNQYAQAESGALARVVGSSAFYAFVALCQEHRDRHYSLDLTPGSFTGPGLLHKILSHPLARTLVVDEAGRALEFSAQPLVWQLERSAPDPRDYELTLRLPDAAPVPPGAFHLPGEPDYYIHGGTIYAGPPALDGTSATGAVVPAEAVERPAALQMFHELGARLPPEIEARFITVSVRARIECALELDPYSDNEALALQLLAVSDRPTVRRAWTSYHWDAPPKVRPDDASADQDKIYTFDMAQPNLAAARLPGLNVRYDDLRKCWTRRVTRSFPDEFLDWREALPAGVEVLATGELASLLNAPVRARVDFELIESPAHRDWFDLALALKPEDTTLTPEEIALLLKARGKLVRLPGKGWRRLQVEIEGASAEALEAAGFDRQAVADAALAGERHRFHALQLAQTAVADLLPERQAEALRARAREIALPEPPAIPAGLRAELRPYQKEGFHFLAFLSANRLGGVLADDMGLGKTVQTLAWLLWLAGRKPTGTSLRVLVVCPKSVVGTWESEAAKFAPGLQVVRFTPAMRGQGLETKDHGPRTKDPRQRTTDHGPRTTDDRPPAPRYEIVVANYAQLRLGADYFTAQRWDALVLDEGQFIKTPTSKVAQVARELPGEHRLILTGTPIENRLLDLWSLFSFTLPGLLGTQASFKRHYAQENPLALPRLRARVRHFLLRRTKAQVATDLPPRTEEDVLVELEGEQAKLYQAELKRARAELLKVETAREFDQVRFNILASLLRLRQICCHPVLIDRAHREAPAAKLEELLERLEELRDEGHQVLVFSQFVEMLELIRERLVAAGIEHLMLTGQTENRDELVAEFQSNKQRTVFLLSLKAAGFGLNLTAASYVILYDPWWNPAVEAQAIDRTHRIGQAAPVIAYRLIARGTVEEKIRALQGEKAALASAIIQEESLTSMLDLDSLRQILS